MGDFVIRAENVAKQYFLPTYKGDKASYETIRESAMIWARDTVGRLNPFGPKREQEKTDEFWALRGVGFTIGEGETVGIIGRNGAGKSTLLKILSRITEPTVGRVRIRGRIASLLEVGTGFHPELTGRENIYLNGAILGMSRVEIHRKFDEIVAFADVSRFLDTPVKKYSSGMHVRLGFAVAAHLDPEILLVDEVLSVGDAAFQKKCLGKMGEVATREGRTVLFVSHNLASVQNLCSRGIFLEGGEVKFDGEVNSAVEQYLASGKTEFGHKFNLLDQHREAKNASNVSFSKCVILDSKERPNSELRLGEPFGIHVEIVSETNLDNATLFVGIETMTHIRVVTIKSEESGLTIDLEKGRTHRLDIMFDDLRLSPGHYVIHLNLRKGHGSLDRVDTAATFEVTSLTHGSMPKHDNTSGFVKATTRWTLTDRDISPRDAAIVPEQAAS